MYHKLCHTETDVTRRSAGCLFGFLNPSKPVTTGVYMLQKEMSTRPEVEYAFLSLLTVKDRCIHQHVTLCVCVCVCVCEGGGGGGARAGNNY